MLTLEQNGIITNRIKNFLVWLTGRLETTASRKYKGFGFLPPDNSDWFMRICKDKSTMIDFNTKIMNNCSFDYFCTVVIHECFHLFVQDVPNKIDATRVKDDFGDTIMTLMDVEADLYTYMYFRDVLEYSLVDFLRINFSGVSVFSDPSIRPIKFERFIASHLSIINNNIVIDNKKNDVFIVSTKHIPTEDALHALISKGSHFQQASINIDKSVLGEVRNCYSAIGRYANEQDYVRFLIEFGFTALWREVPDNVKSNLDNAFKK